MPILFWNFTQLCNYWSNCTIVLTFCHLNSSLCNTRAPSRKCRWLTRAQRRSTASRMSSWCPILVTPSSSSSWWVMCSSCSPPICSRSKFFTYCWRQSSRPDEMTARRVLEHCWLSSVDTVNQGCEWIIHQHTVAFLSLSLFIMLHQFSVGYQQTFFCIYSTTCIKCWSFSHPQSSRRSLSFLQYGFKWTRDGPSWLLLATLLYYIFNYMWFFSTFFDNVPGLSSVQQYISNPASLSAIRLDFGIFPWDNISPSFLKQPILSSSCVTSYENLWRVCGWKPDFVEKVKNHVFCFYYVWFVFVTGAPATKLVEGVRKGHRSPKKLIKAITYDKKIQWFRRSWIFLTVQLSSKL